MVMFFVLLAVWRNQLDDVPLDELRSSCATSW